MQGIRSALLPRHRASRLVQWTALPPYHTNLGPWLLVVKNYETVLSFRTAVRTPIQQAEHKKSHLTTGLCVLLIALFSTRLFQVHPEALTNPYVL